MLMIGLRIQFRPIQCFFRATLLKSEIKIFRSIYISFEIILELNSNLDSLLKSISNSI